MQPSISVIMPNYNGLDHLEVAIRSVIRQTYSNWELVIVDDGSTDTSLLLIDRLMNEDSRIVCVKHRENLGIARARNSAMQRASGDFFAFLDSDDLWHPEKLERQITFMKERDCLISYTRFSVIDLKLRTLRVMRIPSKTTYQTLLWRGNPMGCLTVMVDRRIGPFQMPMMHHEDYSTWLSLMKDGNVACGLHEDLAAYRVHRRSASYKKTRAMVWTYRIFKEHLGTNHLNCMLHFATYSLYNIYKRLNFKRSKTERWIIDGHHEDI